MFSVKEAGLINELTVNYHLIILSAPLINQEAGFLLFSPLKCCKPNESHQTTSRHPKRLENLNTA